MQISGEVSIVFPDGKTITQQNLIPDLTHNSLLTNTNNGVFYDTRISISSSEATPTPGNATVSNVLATGTFLGTPVLDSVSLRPSGTITCEIPAPISDRQFRTVALTTLAAGNGLVASATARAYVRLYEVVTQPAGSPLTIVYRIIVGERDADPRTQKARVDFLNGAFLQPGAGSAPRFDLFLLGYSPFAAYLSVCDNYFCPWLSQELNSTLIENTFNDPIEWCWDSSTVILSQYKKIYRKTLANSQHSGKILNTLFQGGRVDDLIGYSPRRLESNNPIQKVQHHGVGSSTPFPVVSPVGTGTVELAGNWTGTWPELYQIEIVEGGENSAATYKWRSRPFLGFKGNTFDDLIIPNPFRHPLLPSIAGLYGNGTANVLTVSERELLQWVSNGLSVVNLYDGTYFTWVIPNPGLNPNQIIQIVVSGRVAYIATILNGLYEVNLDTRETSQSYVGPCLGVDVGRQDVVFIVTDKGFRSSDDSFVTLLPLNVTLPTDWLLGGWALRVDPEHPNDRMAFKRDYLIDLGGGNFDTGHEICWYQASDGTFIRNVLSSGFSSYTESLEVSDSGSFWVASKENGTAVRLDWGTSTETPLATIAPVDNKWKVSFYNNHFIAAGQVVNSSNEVILSFPWTGVSWYILPFGPFYLKSDGSFSILDSAWTPFSFSHLTHLDFRQSLPSDLLLRFTEGTFVTGETYIVPVCHGVLKDTSTTIELKSCFYTQRLTDGQIRGIIDAANLQIFIPQSPAGETPDRDWIRLDVGVSDTKDGVVVEINEILASNLIGTGTDPTSLTVRIQPDQGSILFSTEDAGKEYICRYSFLSRG